MRTVSGAFRRKLEQNTSLLARATLMLADGTVRELSGDDLVSLSVEQATSSSGRFDVGAAIVGELDLTLNNHDQRFDEYDFTGAQLVAYCGCQTGPNTTEWVRLGTYVVDQPDAYAGTIALSALDYMSRLEYAYANVKTSYPATLQGIVADACSAAGVTLATPTFPNGSWTVSRRPSDDRLTCLNIVSYAAQAAGLWARADERGRVVLGWYDLESLTAGEESLDGRHFDPATPYATGDTADGGTFDNYGGGAVANGGLLSASYEREHLHTFSRLTVFTDDVVVTGVRVTAQNEVKVGSDGKETNGADGETALFGGEGYVLELTGNKLVPYGSAADVAEQVGRRVIGMRFRPFSGTHVADPTVEAGDVAIVSDYKQDSYPTCVTSVKLDVNSSMKVECSAKSASRNSAPMASAATKAVAEARSELKREQDTRERAIADFDRRIEEHPGLYSTVAIQADGSRSCYFHDRPKLAESKVVWRMTPETAEVSTDGGKTYATALDATGDGILQRIYAIGIDGGHIMPGTVSTDRIETSRGSGTALAVSEVGGGVGLSVPGGSGYPRLLMDVSGIAELAVSEDVYVRLDASGIRCRFGDGGFGWVDGKFSDSLSWG